MYRGAARTFVKRTRQLLAEGKVDEAEAVAQKAYSTLDKAGRRRILHPRNAARRKGRLMAQVAAAREAAE